ncbi:MAG: aspartate kinase [Acidaminobacteraceae bacterium]
MDIIVRKYGGTSVSTKESRDLIAKDAIELKRSGKYPVIVVSAIGRSGDPYATDTLISKLTDVDKGVSTRELDMIMSCGEIISAAVMAATIAAKGEKAIALTGFQAGIITDNIFSDANVIEVDTKKIITHLKNDEIVVVTGFQGISKSGDITTLGRGGSDNTAAILGSALNADSIEIYTDVDGVMTADPRIVADAKVLSNISYDEVYQMAIDGAKVVDHKAIEVAKQSGRILKIKNTFSRAEGTVISSEELVDKSNMDKNLITAVTARTNVSQYTVNIDSKDDKNEKLLVDMENNGISIDLINFFDDRKVYTINTNDMDTMNQILKKLKLEYFVIEDCSKIAIIGHRINGIPGVMRRIVLALHKEKIEILQSSDSNTSIWCLVKADDTKDAIKSLHDEFELSK